VPVETALTQVPVILCTYQESEERAAALAADVDPLASADNGRVRRGSKASGQRLLLLIEDGGQDRGLPNRP
jgi:hypothetical protein